jgi:hypothetical protein
MTAVSKAEFTEIFNKLKAMRENKVSAAVLLWLPNLPGLLRLRSQEPNLVDRHIRSVYLSGLLVGAQKHGRPYLVCQVFHCLVSQRLNF